MKKMLLLFCFVAVASLAASATSFTVSFTPYCDGMAVHNPSGISFGGTHILGNCVNNYYGGGFKHGATGFTYYAGSAYDFSDPLYGMEGINSSLQYLLSVTGTARRPGNCGWVIYEGPDGVGIYLLNYGTCTRVANAAAISGKGKSSASR